MSDELDLPDADEMGAYIDEYIADARNLRRQGMTISSYLQSCIRDDCPTYKMDATTAARIDAKAAKAFGPMPNLSNPLAFGL